MNIESIKYFDISKLEIFERKADKGQITPKRFIQFLENLNPETFQIKQEDRLRFLTLLKRLDLSNCGDLYKNVLSIFRTAFGLPKKAFDRDVALISKDKETSLKCSEELLSMIPFFSTMLNSNFKESTDKQIELNLSTAALEAFYAYLYKAKINTSIEVLQELLPFSQMIMHKSFEEQLVELILDYYADKDNEPSCENCLDPDFLENYSERFAKKFLVSRGIDYLIYPNGRFIISLNDFTNIFKRHSNLLKILISEIDMVWFDGSDPNFLSFCPKEFRKQIINVYHQFDDEADTFIKAPNLTLKEFKLLYRLLPNATFEVDLLESIKKEMDDDPYLLLIDYLLDPSSNTINLDARFSESYYIQGNEELKKGNASLAVGLFNEAIKKSPNKGIYYAALAKAYGLLNNHKEHVRALKRTLVVSPKNESALAKFGKILMTKGKLEEAKKTFIRLAKLSDSEHTQHCLAYIYSQTNNLQKAIEHLKKSLEITDQNIYALEMLSNLFIIHHNYFESKLYLEKLLALEPNNIKWLQKYCTVLFMLGEFAEEEQQLLKLLTLDPNNIDTLHILAELYQKQSRLNEYINTLEKLYKILSSLKKFQQAEGFLLKLVQLVPSNRHLIELMYCLAAQQKVGDALAIVPRLTDPDSISVLLDLGNFYLLINKPEETIECLEKVLKIDPKNVQALSDISFAHILLENLERAETYLKQAKLLENDNFLVNTRLGQTSRLKGDLKSAKFHYLEALKVMPNNAVILSELGECFRLENNLEEAEGTIRKALQLDPENNFAAVSLYNILKNEKDKKEEALALLSNLLYVFGVEKKELQEKTALIFEEYKNKDLSLLTSFNQDKINKEEPEKN